MCYSTYLEGVQVRHCLPSSYPMPSCTTWTLDTHHEGLTRMRRCVCRRTSEMPTRRRGDASVEASPKAVPADDP